MMGAVPRPGALERLGERCRALEEVIEDELSRLEEAPDDPRLAETVARRARYARALSRLLLDVLGDAAPTPRAPAPLDEARNGG